MYDYQLCIVSWPLLLYKMNVFSGKREVIQKPITLFWDWCIEMVALFQVPVSACMHACAWIRAHACLCMCKCAVNTLKIWKKIIGSPEMLVICDCRDAQSCISDSFVTTNPSHRVPSCNVSCQLKIISSIITYMWWHYNT